MMIILWMGKGIPRQESSGRNLRQFWKDQLETFSIFRRCDRCTFRSYRSVSITNLCDAANNIGLS